MERIVGFERIQNWCWTGHLPPRQVCNNKNADEFSFLNKTTSITKLNQGSCRLSCSLGVFKKNCHQKKVYLVPPSSCYWIKIQGMWLVTIHSTLTVTLAVLQCDNLWKVNHFSFRGGTITWILWKCECEY